MSVMCIPVRVGAEPSGVLGGTGQIETRHIRLMSVITLTGNLSHLSTLHANEAGKLKNRLLFKNVEDAFGV